MSRFLRHFEVLLALALVVEVGVFAFTAENFFTLRNFFEVVRQNADVALLALAMTAVILTGGIDLSAGSALGLSAVLFGLLWRDGHWPVALAAVGAVVTGTLCGGLNALLITRLQLPPLIVTLGSFSLFRGLAEAITRGTDNYTGFPPEFLYLGQGYIFGFLPAQLPVALLVAAAFWYMVHGTVVGRSLRAIGFAPEGARYAGLPVTGRLALVYLLSGAMAGLAALLYVAHLGQAKADAGTGFELLAITAVVLGGTSIFGGTGSITGTLLGLAILAVLRNGLTLADQPSELGGILTGALLVGVLLAGSLVKTFGARRRTRLNPSTPA